MPPRRIERMAQVAPSGVEFVAARPLLRVRSLAASVAYYRDRLGFAVADVVEPGWLVVVRRGPVEIELEESSCEADVPYPERGAAAVRVADVAALAAELVRAGAVIDQGPTDQGYGRRDLSIVDPDGYQIVF